jgi:endonuclease/exonuclease/phosphatase family metal-dependent hydrolase
LQWTQKLTLHGQELWYKAGAISTTLEFDLLRKILSTIRQTSEILTIHQGTSVDPLPSLKVISANLCHPWPRLQRGEERLQQFLQLVQDHQADLLILQEVWGTRRYQVHAWLAERLAMNAVYVRTNGDYLQIGFEEGLAILSRYPLLPKGSKILRSSLHPFARRQALAATVKTPGGDLLAVSTHLSISPWCNRRQVQELIEWVEKQSSHAIIGGDFNAPETASRIALLKQRWMDTLRHVHPVHADPTTHQIAVPFVGKLRLRLDYLFLYQKEKLWQILNAGKEARYSFSDHAAVWTHLGLRKPLLGSSVQWGF